MTVFRIAHLTALLFMFACTTAQDSSLGSVYDVQIRWTSYGIPHVKANDSASLGYGFS